MTDTYFDKCDYSKYEHDKLRALLDIASGLSLAKSFDDVGSLIFRCLKKFPSGIWPIGIKLGVLDTEKQTYTVITDSLTYINQDEYIPVPEKTTVPVSEVKYFSKVVIESKKSLLIEDNHSEFALSIYSDGLNIRGHSMLFVPLLYKDDIVGLLSVGREPAFSIPPDFVELFESIAKLVSIKVNDLMIEKRMIEEAEKTKESERLYRSLIETSPDAIAFTDIDMKIVLCNDNLVELLKAPDKDNLIGTSAICYFPEEQRQRLMEGVQAIFTIKKAANREYQLIRFDKNIIECELDVSLILDKNGNPDGFLALIRDVTQRKMEQAELKINEQRMLGLLELHKKANEPRDEIIDFALMETIKLTQSSIGFISFVTDNQENLEIVGWVGPEFDNKKNEKVKRGFKIDSDSIWNKALEVKSNLIINNYKEKTNYKVMPEFHSHIERVMVIPVLYNEKVVLIACIVNKESDYTESDSRQASLFMYELWGIIQNKNYLETIYQNKELFQNLVETVNDWIFEIDTKGIITYSSPRGKDFLGIEDHEMIGKSIIDYLPDDEKTKLERIYSEYDFERKESLFLENAFRDRKGGLIYLESSLIPFLGKTGKLAGFRVIARDISMRKYFEKKIDRMERMYQAIVEDQTELIARFTPSGIITFVNNAYSKYFGLQKESLIGRNLLSFLPEEFREILKTKLSHLSAENPFMVSLHREQKPDGSLNAIEWIHHAILDEKKKIIEIQSVGRDISKQKEYEEQIAEKNKLIESILQTNPNSLYIYSLSTGSAKFISKNIYTLLGYSEKELLDMGNDVFKNTIHPDDAERVRKNVEKMSSLKDGEIISSEQRVRRKDGKWVWLMTMESIFRRNEEGEPIEVIGSSVDISERKRIQEELVAYKNDLEKIVNERTNRLLITNKSLELEIKERKLTEDKLIKNKIILDAIGDGVLTINMQGVITSFNKSAESITGYFSETAIGSRCSDIFRILEPEVKLEDIIENNTRIIEKHIHIRSRRGDLIPLSLSTYVLYQSGIESFEIAVTFKDLSQIEILKKELDEKYSFQDIIAKSPKIRQLFTILPDIAQSDSAVLIEGETGTGKELFAKAIYNLSRRKEMPFITINCAAIPSNLLESELFGYMKGSFTDAKQDKKGKVLLADGGTLFLDEIGELPILMQSKLLRLLENFEFEPIGAVKPVKVNIRIIAATNRNLKDLVEEGTFRADLYYRMNTVKLLLPPLRERNEDIPYLVEHFVRKFRARFSKNISGVEHDVLKVFHNFPFPGNVRELEKIIEYAFIICDKEKIALSHLPPELISPKEDQKEARVSPEQNQIHQSENEHIISIISDYLSKMNISGKKYHTQKISDAEEKELIITTIRKNNGNKANAARELNMHYTTLWKKLKKYNIQ